MFALLAQLMPEDTPAQRSDDAIAALASMVGVLILARTVTDERLSDRILTVTTKRVTQSVKVRTSARRT